MWNKTLLSSDALIDWHHRVQGWNNNFWYHLWNIPLSKLNISWQCLLMYLNIFHCFFTRSCVQITLRINITRLPRAVPHQIGFFVFIEFEWGEGGVLGCWKGNFGWIKNQLPRYPGSDLKSDGQSCGGYMLSCGGYMLGYGGYMGFA